MANPNSTYCMRLADGERYTLLRANIYLVIAVSSVAHLSLCAWQIECSLHIIEQLLITAEHYLVIEIATWGASFAFFYLQLLFIIMLK